MLCFFFYRILGKDLVLKDFAGLEKRRGLHLQELVDLHCRVVDLVKTFALALLLIKNHRGLTYMAAQQHFTTCAEYMQWLFTSFQVSYETARRCRIAVSLINKFPVCR